MSDEDDQDVVRWGSELHRVFGDEWAEAVYREDNEAPQEPRRRPWLLKPPVRRLTFELVQSICFSSQMLEEDAIGLAQLVGRCSPGPRNLLNGSTLINLGASVFASLGIYLSPWKYKMKMLTVYATLAVPMICPIALYVSEKRSKSLFNKFLEVNGRIMVRMYSAYKKFTSCKAVHEAKKRQFSSNNDPQIEDYFHYHQAEHAMHTAIENLTNSTRALIALTRDSLVKIIDVSDLEITPEEILVNESADFLLNDDFNILAFRDCFYAANSQLLRIIGTGLLSRSSNLTPILRIIESSIPKYRKQVELLHFNLSTPNSVPRATRLGDFEMRNCGALMNKFNSEISSIWMESSNLEKFIEEKCRDGFSPAHAVFVEGRMRHIDKLMLDCSTTFRETWSLASTYLKKKNSTEATPSEVQPEREDTETHHVVQVGRSDFTVDQEYQMFVCLDNDEPGEIVLDVDDVQEVRPQLPPGLVRELKGALERKKVEINQRELDALKRQFPSDLAESICAQDTIQPYGDESRSRSSGYSYEVVGSEPFHLAPDSAEFEAQKNISASVAAICKNMRLCETETFASSDDEDYEGC